jgi:rRNA-processing protein FCF1
LVERIRTAVGDGRLVPPVVVVLEGAARGGAEVGEAEGVRVVHAPAGGDDTLVSVAAGATGPVTLVSADRELRRRAGAVGAEVVGPRWLTGLLDG